MQHRRVAPARCRYEITSEPCVPLIAAHGSSKPRGRCRLKRWLPALAGLERPVAGRVHEAGLVTIGWAWSAVGEIAGGYRLAGDVQPPSFPLSGRLGWLFGVKQVVPAQRAYPVLPGEQAQGVAVQRGFDLLAPFGPVSGQRGVIG